MEIKRVDSTTTKVVLDTGIDWPEIEFLTDGSGYILTSRPRSDTQNIEVHLSRKEAIFFALSVINQELNGPSPIISFTPPNK